MERKTFNCMGYNELDKLINDTFFEGKNKYEFVCDEELMNDVIKSYDGIDGVFHYKWDKEETDEFLTGKTSCRARLALNELCRRGIIPAGNYLINVSW